MSFSFFKAGKRIWSLCAEKSLAAYSAGVMIRVAMTTAIPLFLGVFVDSLVYGGKTLIYFFFLTSDAFLACLLDLYLRKTVIQIARNREQQLQFDMLEMFQSMKPSAVDVYRNGEITMKFYRDAGIAGSFISSIYPQFLNLVFGFVFALTAVFLKKPLIAVFFLLFLPLLFFCLWFHAARLTRTVHFTRSIYDRSINGIFEFMYIFPYLKALSADEPYFAAPKSKFKTYRKINILNDKTAMSLEYANRFILLLGEYSVLGIAGWLAWKKQLQIGDVVMFQVLFLSVLNSFSGLFMLYPNWKITQEGIDSIYELLATEQTENIECNPPIPSALADITVRDISFQYRKTSPKVFNGFSCKIPAGSVVGLTGMNGSGKTTLLKLLTGYLLPDAGSVEIGGKNLCDWQIKSFRQKISYVFQDSLLITGTIRDNITLKNAEYTESDVSEALQLSGADQIVARVPDGLDHKIGQNGGGLSGGERQKIAIARALIRKPEILIFDEVTNHLDFQSRIRIREVILSLRGKTTIFLVSHDPELLKLCDQEIKL